MTLTELLKLFGEWLYLPDPSPVLVVVGAVVGNLLPGDPVWLLLVGPPSSGKTELLSALSKLERVHEVSTLTEAGLLSGSVSRDPSSTGGLLAELGRFGVIVCKDFTSLLAEAPDTRSGLLAALREVYDGGWVRRLGNNGGRTVGWAGKAGLLAGVTETIDRHSAVMGAMGERFVSFRMPVLDDEGRLAQARTALGNAGRQAEMRAAFRGGRRRVRRRPRRAGFDTTTGRGNDRAAGPARRPRHPVPVHGGARPADREVELVPQAEAPGRLQAVLAQLLGAFAVVGLTDDEAGALVARVALDSMSKARRAVVELFAGTGSGTLFTSRQVGDAVGLPTGAAGRVLDDLAAHGVVERHSGGDRDPHRWRASTWLRDRWVALGLAAAGTGPVMVGDGPEADDGEEGW